MFTFDNTQGYNDFQLAELNREVERRVREDQATPEQAEVISEQVQRDYDTATLAP